MTTPAIEEQEIAEDNQQEEVTPDPVEEHFTRLQAQLDEQANYAKGVGNYVGRLGRQIEDLLGKPQTAATREELAEVLQRLENIELRAIDDPDELREEIKKRREVVVKPKAEELPKPIIQSQEERDGELLLSEYEHSVKPEWIEAAEELKVPWLVVWPKIEAKIGSKELRRGEPTATDKRGWRPLTKDVKALIKAEATLWQNQQNRARGIDTTRGEVIKTTAESRYAAWLKGEGPKPSAAEIDATTAKYATM